jgi:hypothetical protein
MDCNLISRGFCCPTLLDDLVVPSDLMQYTFLVEFLWSYYERVHHICTSFSVVCEILSIKKNVCEIVCESP